MGLHDGDLSENAIDVSIGTARSVNGYILFFGRCSSNQERCPAIPNKSVRFPLIRHLLYPRPSFVYTGKLEEEEVRVLERGDYFGEQALLKEDCRSANVIALPPGVECLSLGRE